MRVGRDYVFDGPDGKKSLGDLCAGRSPLIVYHFMLDPAQDEGCAHCPVWAGHFDSLRHHLGQRDTTFVAISRAPRKTLRAFQQRMGWSFQWLSSGGNGFGYDFHASVAPEQIRAGQAMFNCATAPAEMADMSDREGASATARSTTPTRRGRAASTC